MTVKMMPLVEAKVEVVRVMEDYLALEVVEAKEEAREEAKEEAKVMTA